jgi:hypothetical protein
MAVQTTYTERTPKAIAGQRGNLIPEKVISRTMKNGDSDFGVIVVQADGDFNVTTIGNQATADPGGYVGITVRDQAADIDKVNGYPEDATAGVMVEGTIWVNAYEAVDAGDDVYFLDADGTLGKTTSSATQIPNARWETSTTGAGLALLRLG